MKSKTVDTIVSPEEEVRLRIYDGDIPLENAGSEILKMLIALTGANNRVLGRLNQHDEYIRQTLQELRAMRQLAPGKLTRWQHLRKAVLG